MKAELLASGLAFSNALTSGVQSLVLDMVNGGSPTATMNFETSTGRPAMVVVTVDEEQIEYLEAAFKGDDTADG